LSYEGDIVVNAAPLTGPPSPTSEAVSIAMTMTDAPNSGRFDDVACDVLP
jgi:hypothetical protein